MTRTIFAPIEADSDMLRPLGQVDYSMSATAGLGKSLHSPLLIQNVFNYSYSCLHRRSKWIIGVQKVINSSCRYDVHPRFKRLSGGRCEESSAKVREQSARALMNGLGNRSRNRFSCHFLPILCQYDVVKQLVRAIGSLAVWMLVTYLWEHETAWFRGQAILSGK